MKRKAGIFLIIVYLTFDLSGCWSSKELNNINIATAIGIDKSDEGYLVTVQLINPREIAKEKSSKRSPITTHRTTGKSIYEAIRKLSTEVPREIYIAHTRLIVIDEELAREDGIADALDSISRNHEMRTDFYVMISRGSKAEKVLNILTPLEEISAYQIYSTLETSEKIWAPTHHVRLDELVSCLITEGKEPVLTGVFIKGNPEEGNDIHNVEKADVPTTVQIDYLCIFNGDKLVGWLNEYESIGYNHIKRTIKSTIVNVPWNTGEIIGIELTKTKPKISVSTEEGEPIIIIEKNVEGNIADAQADIDFMNFDSIEELEESLEKEIENKMEAAVKRAQELKSDIFGFGEDIHRYKPELWKELKGSWNREFQKLKVEIDVSAEIKRIGTSTESLKKAMD